MQRTGRQRGRWIERVLSAQDLLDFAVAGDDEGYALRVAVRPDAIGFAHAAVFIGEQRERQLQAVGELLLRVDVVGGDAQDLGIGVGELRGEIAKSRQLTGSTAGEGLGKEGEHHRAPLEFLERDRLAVRRGAREVRGALAGGQSRADGEQRRSDEKRTHLHPTTVHPEVTRRQSTAGAPPLAARLSRREPGSRAERARRPTGEDDSMDHDADDCDDREQRKNLHVP